MNTEEKARAYDEALERCKEWASGTWGHSVDDSPKDIAEFIFPQLAESEDERIRKALVDFFDSALGKDLLQRKCGLNPDAVLAWFEKQKDASKAIEAVDRIDKYIDEHLANAHDMKDSNPDKKYYRGWDDALGKMAGILQDVYSGEKQKYDRIQPIYDNRESFESALDKAWNDYHNGYENVDKLEDDYVECAYAKGFREGYLFGIKKQKEPHFTKRNALFDKCVENCDPEVMNKVSDEIDEMLQKEQKPFNVCEQCKCPDYNEQKSTECIDFDNEFENQVSHLLASVLNSEHEYNEGFVKYAAQSLLEYAKNEMKPYEWDKREKLFTKALQTANAQIGQLFEENKKLKEQQPTEIDEYKIIKKHITEDSLSSEVNKRLTECGWYVTDTESSEWNEDIIQKAIKEVGLTQHQIDWFKTNVFPPKQEWSDEDEGELQNAIDALEFLGKKGMYKSESGYDAALKAASWLKSFRLQLKLDWSKEDKVYLEDALWCVKQAAKVAKDENGMGACWSAERWLKSLSERFNVSPKQEWNKEDDKMLSRCIKSIESSKQFAASSVYEKDKEINWIKSLSERFNLQPNPEWSEEDKRKLDGIIQWLREYQKKFNPKYDSLSIESIESLINWFKSLRSCWKPSEEQMKWLKDVIETVPMTCRQQVPLESLYNDLKKLM